MIERREKTPARHPAFVKTIGAMPTEFLRRPRGRTTTGRIVGRLLTRVAKTTAARTAIARPEGRAGRRKIAADLAPRGCTVHAAAAETGARPHLRRQPGTAQTENVRLKSVRITSENTALDRPIGVRRTVGRHRIGMPVTILITQCITTARRPPTTPPTEPITIDTEGIGMTEIEIMRIGITQTIVLRRQGATIAVRRRVTTIVAGRVDQIGMPTLHLRIIGRSDHPIVNDMNETTEKMSTGMGDAGIDDRPRRLSMLDTVTPTIATIHRPRRGASAMTTK